MIAVTGATGHIGNVLVRQLVESGEKVRVLVLDKSDKKDLKSLEGIEIEIVECDIRDYDSVEKALKGARYVYHLAAIVSIVSGMEKLLYEVNVNGTKNIVNACLRNKVKRLVYVSSVHALKELTYGKRITEEIEMDESKVEGVYSKSKILATKEVLKGIKQGLDTVIVYPSGVIGPFDYKGSEMGKMIRSYLKGKMKFFIQGGYNFVDVRDVASGMIMACKNGKNGEGYLLSGHEITVEALFKLLNDIAKLGLPRIKVPLWIAKLSAGILDLLGRIFQFEPFFTPYAIHVLQTNYFMSNEKAKKEFGFSTRLLKDTLKDTIEWIKKNNL